MPNNSLESQLHKFSASRSKTGQAMFKIEANKHQVSPSISEISKNTKKSPEITFKIHSNKKKKRKRIPSESSLNHSSTKLKKKKKNFVKKYPRLIFDESIDESLNTEDCEVSQKDKKSSHSKEFFYVSEDSDIDPLNMQIEGLKLHDIFKPAPSRYLSKCHNLKIPQKHFQVSETEFEPASKIYEIQSDDDDELIESSKKQDAEHVQNVNNQEILNDCVTNEEEITEIIQKSSTTTLKTSNNPDQDLDSEHNSECFININLNNNDVLLVLNSSEKTYFCGLCAMEVLQGKIEILGAHLTHDSGVKKVYSPRGSALLCVQNLSQPNKGGFIEIQHFVEVDLLKDEDKNLSVSESAGVILCRKLEEPYVEFIERHISQVIFPTRDSGGPRIKFNPQGAWNRLHTDDSWSLAIQDATQTSKIAVCGGKGVGKSTVLRYCVNKLLQKFNKVTVVDLDSGQTEFTVPGCLSIVNVTEELLGPSYTHQQPFERAVLSHINVGYDIKQYLRTVESLLDFLNTQESTPTLFNFCGYHKGLGLDMTMKIINMIKPTKLLQINSSNKNKNYSFDLTVENVKRNLKDFNWRLNYEFVELRSGADYQKFKVWTMEARISREIQILSYFGKMMSTNVKHLTSCELSMYSINLTSLKITDSERNIISPLAINANLVGLCSISKQTVQYLCHGWGFVRGIDIEKDILVLLTPENLDSLNRVDHLVLTTNSVVPSLLMATHEVQGHIPYVSENTPSDMAQLTKRSYVPPKTKW